MGGEPQYPGEARGRLCWGERLCMTEALMEQALVTWKVCLPSVLFLLGPARQSQLLSILFYRPFTGHSIAGFPSCF